MVEICRNRFETEGKAVVPVDPDRLRANQLIRTSIEYRGQIVEEGYTLKVVRVHGKGSERAFVLEDILGRPYQITVSALETGRQGALIFNGVYANKPANEAVGMV